MPKIIISNQGPGPIETMDSQGSISSVGAGSHVTIDLPEDGGLAVTTPRPAQAVEPVSSAEPSSTEAPVAPVAATIGALADALGEAAATSAEPSSTEAPATSAEPSSTEAPAAEAPARAGKKGA